MKLKADKSGVAQAPRVQWWLLCVPLVLLVVAGIAVRQGTQFRGQSLVWNAIERVGGLPTRQVQFPGWLIYATVSTSGDVEVVNMEGSWDELNEALKRTNATLWSIAAGRVTSYRGFLVPSVAVTKSNIAIEPATMSSTPPDEQALYILRTWMKDSDSPQARELQSAIHPIALAYGAHTEYRLIWGHVALNIALIVAACLLPFSALAWRNALHRRRFYNRLAMGTCVQCSYQLAALDSDTPTRCPECGTLNPPPPRPPLVTQPVPPPSAS